MFADLEMKIIAVKYPQIHIMASMMINMMNCACIISITAGYKAIAYNYLTAVRLYVNAHIRSSSLGLMLTDEYSTSSSCCTSTASGGFV